uniref:Uncharacterized protein n=1 Tax=Lygus hesperus TaxID=30085 RepID=A0A0K8S7U2_LYGHE
MAPRFCDNMTIHKRKSPVTSFKAPDLRGAEIISDVTTKKWRLGKAIGVGAFGQIFLASDDILKPVSPDTSFIVKMEPYTSGPLFVERNFYLRAAKTDTIQEYMQSKKVTRLGVPHIYSFGTCFLRDVHMRFIVMPKVWSQHPVNACETWQ